VTFSPLNYAILVAYLAAMVGIGFLFAGRQKTTEDYFLAGRNMSWLVVAMSMYASLTSATTYLALPGKAYSENVALIVVCVVSPLLVPFLVTLFYPFYRRLRVTTSYEYIDRRFGRRARYTVAGLFVLARMGWLGTVIYAPALAFSTVSGVDLWISILGMGLLATLYTVMGGLSAVLWTDVLQFIILVGGAFWTAFSLLGNVPGGAGAILQHAREAGHLNIFSLKPSLVETTGLMVGLSFFLSMMQDYGTDQVTVQRLMATRSYRAMVLSAVFNACVDFVVIGVLLFIGLGILAYGHHLPGFIGAEVKPDQVLPYYVIHALPDGVSGLVVTAIFAAAMSSMDSGINSLATVLDSDFVRPLRKTAREDAHDVTLARWFTAAIGTVATGVAFYVASIGDIIEAFITFISRFSAPVLALFLLGILTRRASFRGWLVGAAAGIAATWALQKFTPINWTYYFPCSFFITFLLGYAASLALPGPTAPDDLVYP